MFGRGRPTRSTRPLWKSSTPPALILAVANFPPPPKSRPPPPPKWPLLLLCEALSRALSDAPSIPSSLVSSRRVPSAKCRTTASTSSRLSCETARRGLSSVRGDDRLQSSSLPSMSPSGSDWAHWTAGVDTRERARRNSARSRPFLSSRSSRLKCSTAVSRPRVMPTSRSAPAKSSPDKMRRLPLECCECWSKTFSTSCRSRHFQNRSIFFLSDSSMASDDPPRRIGNPWKTARSPRARCMIGSSPSVKTRPLKDRSTFSSFTQGNDRRRSSRVASSVR
mmetsp:Transcript_2362/g.6332  ORF Transcript_2362/g.6332 Transcript_2362/m.6332 type:complete len:279 (-) Transcript_2362:371-1207(-)